MRVQRQVIKMDTARYDVERSRRLLELMRVRRDQQPELVRIGEIPDRQGGTTLVVETELLIRTVDLPAISGLLEADPDLQEDPVREGALAGLITRIKGPAAALGRTAGLASTLRRQGVPISANYVTPMGGQWKSVAGPEPTAGMAPRFRGRSRRGKPSVRVVVLDTGVWVGKRSDWLKGLERKDNLEELYRDTGRGRRGAMRVLHTGAGHGSFCAGIVQQVAPDVEVVVERVLDIDGVQDEVGVAEAMVRAVQDGFAAGQHVVLSLSLGTETADDERPVAFGVALDVIEELRRNPKVNKQQREAMVVAAAGNYGRQRPCWPAAFPSVVAVAGLTQAYLPAAWSSHGPWVDACTVGEGVRSTFVPGKENADLDPTPDEFAEGSWAQWTGTSFAAPQVAAAIAQTAETDGSSLTDAEWALLKRSRREIPLYGKVVEVLSEMPSLD